jgi:hypothetical protein
MARVSFLFDAGGAEPALDARVDCVADSFRLRRGALQRF